MSLKKNASLSKLNDVNKSVDFANPKGENFNFPSISAKRGSKAVNQSLDHPRFSRPRNNMIK